MTCARQGRLDMSTALVEAGANVDAGDKLGTTPLYIATQDGEIGRRREFCHSAAPPSPFSRRFNRDDEGVPAK